ncbi:MAG: aminotransferase class V-fold PLP-dependent enzyme [Dethiobacter sp.]|nr:MAG: aminotransferase class V-fold PLP-dependent enzyme [Dethiobacter sp.]
MLYLDNAATSWPKPEEVYRAMDTFIRELGANPGRAGFRMAAEAERVIMETRVLLRDFFHATSPDGVIFTLNGSDALNIALKGLLSPGDHVITSCLEHNSVSRPLNRLAERGVEYSRVSHHPDGSIDPGEIKKLVRPATKLIVLTHASNVLGTLEPVEEIGRIAREHGVLFLLDAAQTAGILPIDMQEMNVNILACPGHKGLLGPPGTGVLVINGEVEISSFREGGTGSLSEEPFHPSHYPDRLEAGTPNTAGIAGLKAGVEFILKEGIERIRSHERELLDSLLTGLLSIPGVTVYGTQEAGSRTGLVSFNMEGWEPQDAAAVLESRFDIACRAGLHCAPWAHRFLDTYPYGAVRFGISYFNNEIEIQAALGAVAALGGFS